jgi:hypothetical protein
MMNQVGTVINNDHVTTDGQWAGQLRSRHQASKIQTTMIIQYNLNILTAFAVW